MLPALQMHPRPVPSHSTFHAFARALPDHDHDHDRDGDADAPHPQQPQDLDPPYRQSFPIRISQPQLHQHVAASPAPLFAPLPEHKLRRKTPNGTVDAGYDGSPIQPCPGPPPLKHMILPASASFRPHVPTNPSQHPFRRGWTPAQHSPGQAPDVWAQPSLPASPCLLDNGLLPSHFSPSQISLGDHLSVQPIINHGPVQLGPDVYQPVMRANEYNVRAICPPPLPMTGSFPFGQISWHTGFSPWDYRAVEQPQTVVFGRGQPGTVPNGRPVLYDPVGHSSPVCLVGQDKLRRTSELNTVDPQSWNADQALNTASVRRTPGRIGQPDFKEKALAHAHQSYVDLLAFLQANGRANPLRTSSGSGTANKLPAYPKLPKTGLDPSQISRVGGGANPGGFVLSDPTTRNRHHGEPFTLRADVNYGTLPRHPVLAGSGQFDSSDHKQALASSAPMPLITPRSLVRMSPVVNAKSSLEILDSLCEQSGWKWMDGMLLGGCLHYGLERFEDALKWFSRIMAIDSSHVEAITNMAATFYCLNRQDDAEQHWLKAVRLRPSYLEATEHLVGLLYKKRSEEAVQVISHVQRALRLPPQKSSDQGFPEGKDYGSSGYALPGSENGRILALVHAKGTMLYSLKDVERASEAFEEAVLISVGRRLDGIQDLIRRIQAVLLPGEPDSAPGGQGDNSLRPLMLPPERARRTAQLVFSGGGELPGLVLVRNGPSKRAALQTTSNSLLSLAKIFQDAMSSGSADPGLLRRSSSVGDILALYYLSLSLQESPSTANNVGILLAGVQQVVPSSAKTSARNISQPAVPGITPGSGMALALAYYNYGLRLDPKHVHLHTNLGSLLKDIGQLDLAIQMYERAVSCDGTFDIALTNLANAVKDKGRINDAITYYRRAVNSNPGFAEAVCGLLTALNSVCNWRGRGGVMLASGKYDRWHVDDEGKLLDVRASGRGSGLTKRVVDIVAQQLKDASGWGRHTVQEPVVCALAQQLQHVCEETSLELDGAIRQWAGKPWEGSRLLRLVERATRVIMRRWYLDLYVSGRESESPYLRPRLPPSLTVPTAPTVLPFHTFTCPLTASDIRTISQRNAMRISCSTLRSPWLPPTVYPPPPPPNPQLNVGYLSSDFNNHPLAHLMQSVFGFHNPSRARAFCYATTASDKSVHRQQIEREAPVFRDVSSWSPDKLIEQIVRDQIHILVNLNGYTRGARNEIFAARPAPIQMSFMGFAGSLGAEWCDYILADTTAIPPSTLRPWRRNVGIEDVFQDNTEGDEGEWVYSENIIFCRDTFFCCDHAQSCDADEKGMTWEEEKRRRWSMRKKLFPTMADDVVILGNFNQLYKIEPTTFRSWLRILARVPKAVLWLLRFPEPGESNLRATAEAWAGPEVASRLIFTDVAPKSQHISRARVCDLFLDTPECNAHTTAADVLWSSTPLLTLPRYPYKMCSRMAASILRGALPPSTEGRRIARELVAESESEYERTAARLAGGLAYVGTDETGSGEGQGRLAEMRKLLWESKWRCGLFNTRRWVEDVESAYEEAWRRWVEGMGGDIYL
ncbi:UDP-N-acetylglucosamine--peptide N-acetylglucosaminyltransferase SEC [Tolypocladium paradoxum]|uniref:protein O-GlcNAc transferase n=1 Tax=Tolypocladium paradoxum TaxID=94208 RepID=A0A2S4KTG5_9HYPO|nr:UDP-N-acetylglucosamine--peptide N-acetylglucosaminyltransferase SEC [Tolypocladium paradoxum]